MAGRRDRQRRKSTARRRAETHANGFEGTCLRLPEGVRFYEMKPGVHLVSVIPYTLKQATSFASVGDLHYEKTYFQWRKIGAEEKPYVCLSKTFGKPDPIQDWKNEMAADDSFDSERLKSMYPRERQLFLLFDHEAPKKGIQLLDFSYHMFGKLLDTRIENSQVDLGWDMFYFLDDEGMCLSLTVEEQSGGGYTYNEVRAIDFLPRKKPLPEEVVEHEICLDDCLVEYSYDDLRKIFLCVEGPSKTTRSGEKAEKKERKRKEETAEKKEIDDEAEEETPKKPSKKTAEDMGISKGDDVIYRAKRHSVLRITDEGESLILVDPDDEMIKGVDPDDCERIDTESEEKNKKKKESKKKEEKPKVEVKVKEKDGDDWDGDDWDEED